MRLPSTLVTTHMTMRQLTSKIPAKTAPQSAGMDHDCATCHMGCAAALVSDLSKIHISGL